MKTFVKNLSDWFIKLLVDTKQNKQDLFTVLDEQWKLGPQWWKRGTERYTVVQLTPNQDPIDDAYTISLDADWKIVPFNCMQNLKSNEYMYKVLAIIKYQRDHKDEIPLAYRKGKKTTYQDVVCHSANNRYAKIIKDTEALLFGNDVSATSKSLRVNKRKRDEDNEQDGEEEEEGSNSDSDSDSDNNNSPGSTNAKTTSTASKDRTSKSTSSNPSTGKPDRANKVIEDLAIVDKQVHLKTHEIISRNALKNGNFFLIQKTKEKKQKKTKDAILQKFFISILHGSVEIIKTQSYVMPESFTRMKIVCHNECSGVFFSLLSQQGVPAPHHIICIIGLPGIYSEILTALALLPQRLNYVKTLSMLLPSTMEEKQFVDIVLAALWKENDPRNSFCKEYTEVTIVYNLHGDSRQVSCLIITFVFVYFIVIS